MVVRMRANRAHRNNRRSHFALLGSRFSKCPDCGTPKVPHGTCPQCGKYKGRVIIDFGKARAKKEKKARAKAKGDKVV